ncbi:MULTISPECIES: hypothetical protein [Yersinia pseudotuberculosis complex]|uniref:Alpha-related fimbriae chaperone 2 n=1 Tax=Yersinia similis TaxID=367190 RepID=A0A0T9PY89_9GAMM|nr:hypothetical protein [Yersinia similis]AHK19470.1 hypothetical protein BF17_09220 [Yersinia similis]CFQ55338.1 alpha-related fimbriae chaperone 2 [Yersinia similis]CNB39196.1 alpha-related fimbriae chaperone 2 [Yersinia similis]CNE73721.1 alpha-related fimbriae chaperone 2 [Yersinia similis]CNF79168.1 alpha-related fimbriae chaperone 2 [Yersinia similis]
MKALVFAVISLLPLSATGVIDIQPQIVEIQQANTVVTVINHGITAEYITVQLYRLNNPGVAPELESLTPVGYQQQPLLFAAPLKLTLGPRQSGKIFLHALGAPEQEQVYRLAVVPDNHLKISGGNAAVVGVQISYMGLIRHLPASIQHQWIHRCIAGKPELHNTGNTRLYWHQLQAKGQMIDDFTLYPGQRRQLDLSELQGKVEEQTVSLQCPSG